VPAQLALMLRDPAFDQFDLSSVSHIIAGGGDHAGMLAEEARRRFRRQARDPLFVHEAGIGLGPASTIPTRTRS
jgi:hypothetical protein